MKKLICSRFVTSAFALVMTLALAKLIIAAEKKEARVTHVIKDVRLLASKAAPRPASLNDNVREGTAVRTGGDSRAELTFTDQTLTRLGANTIFSFGQGARQFDLSNGAILLCVPKESGTVRISTAATTAAVTGFTALFEFHPKSWCKFIILEGHGWIALKKFPNEKKELGPGQIIIFRADARNLPDVHEVDLSKLVNDAMLITQFRQLPSWAWQPILKEIENQKISPPSSGFIDPTGHDKIDQRSQIEQPTPTRMHSPPEETPHDGRRRP